MSTVEDLIHWGHVRRGRRDRLLRCPEERIIHVVGLRVAGRGQGPVPFIRSDVGCLPVSIEGFPREIVPNSLPSTG